MSDLTEWLGGIPEPGTSILAGRNLQTKVPMSDDSLMTIYGDDGPCDLYRGYDNVASGSREAMRAAERLLSGKCEIGPRFSPGTFGGIPFEYNGHWVRDLPPFRQEYDLHFIPDDTPVTRDELAALAKEVCLREVHTRANQLFGVRNGRTYAIPAVRAVDTVTPLHNDDEPGQ